MNFFPRFFISLESVNYGMKSGTFLTLLLLMSFAVHAQTPVDSLLNQWHDAAANADAEKYFSCFENDQSIFMGTDPTERWTISEFKLWAQPFFERGEAWTFLPSSRVVYFNHDRTVAWFDEVLESQHMGSVRGSGVLIQTIHGWKIAHYNMSIPIPNGVTKSILEQIDHYSNPKPE